jgi:hypothetical protein
MRLSLRRQKAEVRTPEPTRIRARISCVQCAEHSSIFNDPDLGRETEMKSRATLCWQKGRSLNKNSAHENAIDSNFFHFGGSMPGGGVV